MFQPRALRIKFIIATLVIVIFTKPKQVSSQEGIVVENAGVAINFGQSITFSAKVTAANPIQQVSLLFQEVNEKNTRVESLQLGQDGSVSFTYDASQNAFPPFSYIVFWFQATLSDGNTYTSAPIKFQYYDDRFPWRQVTQPMSPSIGMLVMMHLAQPH